MSENKVPTSPSLRSTFAAPCRWGTRSGSAIPECRRMAATTRILGSGAGDRPGPRGRSSRLAQPCCIRGGGKVVANNRGKKKHITEENINSASWSSIYRIIETINSNNSNQNSSQSWMEKHQNNNNNSNFFGHFALTLRARRAQTPPRTPRASSCPPPPPGMSTPGRCRWGRRSPCGRRRRRRCCRCRKSILVLQ